MSTPGEGDRPAIDPRHDAIFQRGYQPGQAGPAPVRRPLIGAPPAAPGAGAGAEAEAEMVPSGDPADGLSALQALAFDSDAFQDELPQTARNPFIVSLWVVAVLFIVAPSALHWQAVSTSYAGYSHSGNGPMPLGMIIQQLAYTISPSILTAGLLILAGLLFWHAAAWRARRLSPPDLS